MNGVNLVLAPANAHRTERTRFGSLDDAVDVFALRNSFDRGLFCVSSRHALFTRMDGREMGSTYISNDNQFVSICTSPIELIQNISQRRDRKSDGCDAGSACVRAIFCEANEI